MTTEYLCAIIAALWGLVVPGLPIVIYIKKRFSVAVDVAIASPFVSLGVNYATVYFLNFIGIRLPLWLIACGLIALSIVLLVFTLRLGAPLLKVNINTIIVICATTILTIYLWTTAYAGYLFVAPNADGKHHNFYIARIMDTASAIPRDVLVGSPLTPLGVADDFYPLAWHALVAVPAALFHVTAAPAAMVSALVFWAVVLPIGILRLALLFRVDAYFVGPIAALLSQVIPLVPGIPMSWGAFPSVIGIALLPSALYLVVSVARECSVWSTMFAILAILVLMVVHPPEGFSALLIAPMVLMAVLYKAKSRKPVFVLSGIILIVALAMVNQWDIISRKFSELSVLRGAAAPFGDLLSAFFQMNMNTGFPQFLFALLFIGGMIFSNTSNGWNWLGASFMLYLGMYLLSGASDKPWSDFRFLATPWYTSYERTLWVCVPVAVIFVANSFEGLLSSIRTSNWKLSIFLVPATMFIAVNLVSTLIPATISVIRKGPFENEVVAKEDFAVFQKAAILQGKTGIIYSEVQQGSIYAYMYEGVRVTNGNYGRNGLPSDYVVLVNSELRTICGDLVAQDAFVREEIRGLLLSTRNVAWEGAVWTPEEIRSLPGFQVVAEGKYSYLLIPDFQSCRT